MSSAMPPMTPAMLAALEQEDRAPALLGVMISGLIVSLVVLSLRFWVRTRIVRKVGADDWASLLSFIFLCCAFGLLGTATHYGLGRHAATLDPNNIMYAMKLTWIAFQFTPTAEATGKISVAIMLMRVTTSKHWKQGFMVLIVLNVLINIGMMFSILMSCWPVQMLWNPMIPGHCNILQRDVMSYVQGASAAISDLVLALAPIILLWNVKINKNSKLLLCGLLAIGFFTAIAGFVRVGFTSQTYNEATQMDPTWGLLDFITWKWQVPSPPGNTQARKLTVLSSVELGLSVIVGCLPTLRPIFDGRSWSQNKSRPYTDDSSRRNRSNGSAGKMKILKSNDFDVHWSERSAASAASASSVTENKESA